MSKISLDTLSIRTELQSGDIGLGSKLLHLYLDFLHQCGFQRLYLWTRHELTTAASLYKRLGSLLTEEKDSNAFGKPLREQRYDLIVS